MKPRACPFCAHITIRTLAMRTRSGHYTYGFAATCEACGATGPTVKDEREALPRWNDRSDQADLFVAPFTISDAIGRKEK